MVGDFTLSPKNWERAGKAIAACIAFVTVTIVFCDAFVFRAILPASYVALFGGPDLGQRIAVYMGMAALEDFVFRLIAMSLIAWLIQRLRPRPFTLPWALLAAGLAQGLNVLRLPIPHGAAEFAYDTIRFWGPGLVWGWLYWRHGFVSNVIAHAGTHIALQPTLWLALRT